MFDIGVELIRETLLQALMLAAPILIAGLVIGLLVSIVQTVTSIQEQTLTFVPKIAAMILVGALMAPWIVNTLLEFATDMFSGGW